MSNSTAQIQTHPILRHLQAFGSILNLVPLAESVVKLTAVCMECFRGEAAYTKRLGQEKEVDPPAAAASAASGRGGGRGQVWLYLWGLPSQPSDHLSFPSCCQVEVIGGADKYHSVCRLCYFKKSSVQSATLDNKENCPMVPGEALVARKLFAPQQVLQCSPGI